MPFAFSASATSELVSGSAAGGRQPKNRIFINVVHALGGAWNFNGQAMTNAEIGAAVGGG